MQRNIYISLHWSCWDSTRNVSVDLLDDWVTPPGEAFGLMRLEDMSILTYVGKSDVDKLDFMTMPLPFGI